MPHIKKTINIVNNFKAIKNLITMKNTCAFLVLILSSVFAFGQDSEFKKFRFGLKGAPNISWLASETENLTSDGPKLKFSYGFMAEYYFAENYAFSTGFELLSSGGKLVYPDSTHFFLSDGKPYYINTRTFNLKYGMVPLTLKMKTNEIGYFTYYGQFGINTLFRTGASADDLADDQKTIRPNKDITDEVNLVGLGMNLGLGAEYSLFKNTKLTFGLNWNKGFTSTLKKESENLKLNGIDSNGSLIPAEQKAYLNFVALNVGILF